MTTTDGRTMTMMAMVARYPGTCVDCGRRVAIGDRIGYDRATRTVACGRCMERPAVAPAARAQRPAPAARTAPAQGEREISRPSHGRSDGYDVGTVTHLQRVAGGGGPDGRYWVVTAAGKTRDDLEDGEWICWARVRPATEAEAAPVAARIGAAAARAELVRDLTRSQGERVTVALPADAVVLVPQRAGTTSVTSERVAIVDGAVLHERCGDPDQLDAWYHYPVRITDAALAERVRAWIEATR